MWRKKHMERNMRGRHRKKPEAAVVPPLVPQVAGCGAGSNPADEKRKRKTEETTAGADEKKRPRIQTKRTTVVSQVKPAITSEPQMKVSPCLILLLPLCMTRLRMRGWSKGLQ
ncbi:hypothetical protein Hdeb2414_s0023g00627581 [Helianthus debilis subsp. tardiflorus]